MTASHPATEGLSARQVRDAIAALPGVDIEVSRTAVPLARFQEPLTLDPAKTQVWYRDDGGMVDRAAVLAILDLATLLPESTVPAAPWPEGIVGDECWTCGGPCGHINGTRESTVPAAGLDPEVRAALSKAYDYLGGDSHQRPGDLSIVAAKATLRAALAAATPPESTVPAALDVAVRDVLAAWDALLEGPLATVGTFHQSTLIGLSDKLIRLRLAAATPPASPETA